MPLPLIPLISAGSNLLGNTMNAASNARQNRLNRKFAQHQYDQQRQDSLADYAMMNEYNSPASQMQRFKDGGLNPNLVYGNGATTNAATVRSSSAQSYRGNPNHYDLAGIGQGLMMGYQVEQMKAQTDNVKAATEVAGQELLLKAAQIASTIAGTGYTGVNTKAAEFQLGQSQALNDYVLAAARANVDKTHAEITKTEADTKYTLAQNERSAALNAPSVSLAIEKVLTERLQQTKTLEETNAVRHGILNTENQNLLQQLDITLKKAGIQPSDPAVMRIITQVLNKTGIPSPKEFHDAVNRVVKSFFDGMSNFPYIRKSSPNKSSW